MKKLKFDPKDWEEIHNYLKEWDGWRRKKKVGRPDFTTDAIYIVPLTIALIKSQETTEKLTKILTLLTVIMITLIIIQIFLMLQ